MNKKLKVIEITPVPYAPLEGDLVVVSLEQLIEAQKKTQKALKEEYERGQDDKEKELTTNALDKFTPDYLPYGLMSKKATLSKEGRNK